MDYEELVEKFQGLPNVGSSLVSYLIDIARTERPSSAFLALVPHRDGIWSATQSDLRDKVKTVIGADGAPVRFPDEDSACRWAWEKIKIARSQAGERTEDRAAALNDAETICERVRKMDEARGI